MSLLGAILVTLGVALVGVILGLVLVWYLDVHRLHRLSPEQLQAAANKAIKEANEAWAIQQELQGRSFKVPHATEPVWGFGVGPVTLVNVHDPALCEGRGCCVHHPSNHRMIDWELNWRGDRHIMERICPCHGVGHPDPDDLAFHRSKDPEYSGSHGCPGCCDYRLKEEI